MGVEIYPCNKCEQPMNIMEEIGVAVCDVKGCEDYGWASATNSLQKLRRNNPDAVNPDHYKTGGIETIDYLQAKLSTEAFEGFLAGNVLKYVSRYNKKNGVEDLEKANWYLARLIKLRSI